MKNQDIPATTTPASPALGVAAGSPLHSGYFGPCKGDPLDKAAIAKLVTGDKVEVVWFGGNGPHVYEVRNDLHPAELYRSKAGVTTQQLLEDTRFVALANT